MAKIAYSLSIKGEYVIIRVSGKILDKVYLPGKTRAAVTRDVLFHLHVLDVPVNKDRLQSELDKMHWNSVPKHRWY